MSPWIQLCLKSIFLIFFSYMKINSSFSFSQFGFGFLLATEIVLSNPSFLLSLPPSLSHSSFSSPFLSLSSFSSPFLSLSYSSSLPSSLSSFLPSFFPSQANLILIPSSWPELPSPNTQPNQNCTFYLPAKQLATHHSLPASPGLPLPHAGTLPNGSVSPSSPTRGLSAFHR